MTYWLWTQNLGIQRIYIIELSELSWCLHFKNGESSSEFYFSSLRLVRKCCMWQMHPMLIFVSLHWKLLWPEYIRYLGNVQYIHSKLTQEHRFAVLSPFTGLRLITMWISAQNWFQCSSFKDGLSQAIMLWLYGSWFSVFKVRINRINTVQTEHWCFRTLFFFLLKKKIILSGAC